MEGVLGGNIVPPNSIDKSKVLDVKPLRTLVPEFPGASEGPPFVCVPPNGPFPSGFSPFFPFSGSQGSQFAPDLNQNDINSTAVPIRSFRAEPYNGQNVHRSAGSSPVRKKAKRGRPRGSH